MSKLIAIEFKEYYKADDTLKELQRLQKAHLLDLEDACVVRKKPSGKLKLRQALNLTAMGIVTGSWWGALIGLLIGGSVGAVFGLMAGAGLGALAGKLSDYGIQDALIREMSENLQPGSSAIFVLIKRATIAQLLEEFEGYGGNLMQSSLPDEQTERLQQNLNNHKKNS
jgi:uncharacterized membrane protein